MEPTVETRETIWVLGLQRRITLRAADWAALWAQYHPLHGEIAKLALSTDCYGVYYGTGTPGDVDFLTGMSVPTGTPAREGLALREVSGGLVAVWRTTMAGIGGVWQSAYGEWLPGSGYAEDEARACYECFPEDVEHGGLVEVVLPVRSA